ncbi:MAG: Proline--tRNA ligase [Candidatus Hodgkinia cicadicola]|nr:MAG: Proline--tRNA ligase [Candidatus Hodgkinia cicadicola]
MALVKSFGLWKIGALARHSEGVYTILPYGMFVLNKLLLTLKRVMSKLEIKEVLMPCASRAAAFASRLRTYPELFMITNNNMVLAPTAEEIALSLCSALTLGKLYQVQLKFRNEPRASANLIRSCEFIMKDCYMLFNNRRVLLTEFKRAMSEYKLLFRALGVRVVGAVGDGKLLGACHSFEFVAPCAHLFNTSCYLHVHSLALSSARYLSFTEEYVAAQKVLITESYLRLTGLELAHTFVFAKLVRANAWFASLGIGVSRLLGYVLNSNSKHLDLLSVCNTAIINVANALNAPQYTRYIYCVLRCTALSCVMFETKAHNSVLLGILKRLPPKLIVFVNVPSYGFLMRAQPQAHQTRVFRQTRNLQFVLALAHALELRSVC